MADESKGSVSRDYRGTQGVIDDADGTTERRAGLHRGRVGASRPKSPRSGVRNVDADNYREGDDGEKSYGAPMDTPEPSGERTERERAAKPDPLKTKK